MRSVRSSTAALDRPAEIADRLPPEEAGLDLLYRSADLTVLKVVWAPRMRLYAHDHRMWAAIGIYTGREDNEFFRRRPDGDGGLVESGGKRLDERDVVLLGDDVIHAVANPARTHTGAIHIYGGGLRGPATKPVGATRAAGGAVRHDARAPGVRSGGDAPGGTPLPPDSRPLPLAASADRQPPCLALAVALAGVSSIFSGQYGGGNTVRSSLTGLRRRTASTTCGTS